jgi:hypothetical protein
MSIGEMTCYKPVHGGYIRQTMEYVDKAAAFAMGMNFWFSWVMVSGVLQIIRSPNLLRLDHSCGSRCLYLCSEILAIYSGFSNGSIYHHLSDRCSNP